MIYSNNNNDVWPPFLNPQNPVEVHGLIKDWTRAPLNPRTSLGVNINIFKITVVIPCFNPDPIQFSQLLISLNQQTDQEFDVLIVNDGSAEGIWTLILDQLKNFSWIRVLNQSINKGISNSLNLAINHVKTPYVAFLDQDDLLHPAAISLINRKLSDTPDCRFLYTDHILFNDDSNQSSYIPKFAWNPDALLEFNYLIHLTVVRVDLYLSCGGMDSSFDGIQDWEFYLRLSAFLSEKNVCYLPVPLYAWRISETSTATSSRPKSYLIEYAKDFISKVHSSRGEKTCLKEVSNNDYRFLVSGQEPDESLAANILLFCDSQRSHACIVTLESLVNSCFPIETIYICAEDIEIKNIVQNSQYQNQSFEIQFIKPRNLITSLPLDRALLVIHSGCILRFNNLDLYWVSFIQNTKKWQVLTFPSFGIGEEEVCISAGYSKILCDSNIYLPHGQQISKSDYDNNFASFSHVRKVDLASPCAQFLSSSVLERLFERFESSVQSDQNLYLRWWTALANLQLSCCCIPMNWVGLDTYLSDIEYQRIVSYENKAINLMKPNTWVSSNPLISPTVYAYWLQSSLKYGPSKLHPLEIQEFFKRLDLHPLYRLGAEKEFSMKLLKNNYSYLSTSFIEVLFASTLHLNRSFDGDRYQESMNKYFDALTLLPPKNRRPVVMLIPTELNPRSNGHACMLTLASKMQEIKLEFYLLPFQPYKFFRNYFQQLPSQFQQLPFIVDASEIKNALLIAPESAPKAVIRRLRKRHNQLLWWLLAPAGVLTDFKPDIRKGDDLIAFSEFALPGQSEYLFVHPEPNQEMQRLMGQHRRKKASPKQIVIYTGKGRLKTLPRSLHKVLLTYKIIHITRSFPASKSDLINLLCESKGLISCDPMTNLNLEAANLGIPVYLTSNPFPQSCYKRFPCDLSDFITESPGLFLEKLCLKTPISLGAGRLYETSNKAMFLLDDLTVFPLPLVTKPFKVDQKILDSINLYRKHLLHSATLQTYFNGQSISSRFIRIYLASLKYPYFIHFLFSRVLVFIDTFADYLSRLGLMVYVNRINIVFRPLRIFRRVITYIKKIIGL